MTEIDTVMLLSDGIEANIDDHGRLRLLERSEGPRQPLVILDENEAFSLAEMILNSL